MSIFVTVNTNFEKDIHVFINKADAEKYVNNSYKNGINMIIREFRPFPLVYALNTDGSVSHGPLYHFGNDPASGRAILGTAFDNMDEWRFNEIKAAPPGSVLEEE